MVGKAWIINIVISNNVPRFPSYDEIEGVMCDCKYWVLEDWGLERDMIVKWCLVVY